MTQVWKQGDYCTPEAACHLDAEPQVIPSIHAGKFTIACNRCATPWWIYETPRRQIRKEHDQVQAKKLP